MKSVFLAVFLTVFQRQCWKAPRENGLRTHNSPREPCLSRLSAQLSGRFSIPRERNPPTDKANLRRKHPETGRGQKTQKARERLSSRVRLSPRTQALASATGSCKWQISNLKITGAPGGIRTPDPLLRRQTLYPLSYGRAAETILAAVNSKVYLAPSPRSSA